MGCNCGKRQSSFNEQRAVPATLPPESGPTKVSLADGSIVEYSTRLEALAQEILTPGATIIEE